ncbi:sensor histidine kinase [Chryseobacterium sp. MYb328]|uniref:sensor histidine kinase n=1 Tax=Chryseobacterium sp. MYb328 TaxID=2745231 RepID=UPI0030B540D1
MMKKNANWPIEKISFEVVFFVTVLFLTVLHQWIASNTFGYFFSPVLFFIVVYLQAQLYQYIALPSLINKKYVQFGSITIVYLLLLVLVFSGLNRYWPNQTYHHGERKTIKFIIYYVSTCVISSIFIIFLALIRQYYQALEKRTRDQLLLNEMNTKLLHYQLNPHFFFNMFNNLYGVSLTHPERIPELILQLSNLMRYPLEKGNNAAVSIKEELEYIKTYVNIEKERSGKRCKITLNLPNDKESISHYQIAPLLLITLVENAFKHSAGSLNEWFVKLHFEVNANEFKVDISNSLPETPIKKESLGMGLSNIRKRLDLLYSEHYTFEIYQLDSEYRTILTIQLNAL